ncbi:MAG: choice-of-anchor Q domain-containing protein [Pseudomonadota bacterium]|nr:choice-of-anchor Q domain-containing protein [Pseudomonadota bacterium]
MNQSVSQRVVNGCLRDNLCEQGLVVSERLRKVMKRLLKPISVVTVLTLVQPTFATTIEVNSYLDIEVAQDYQCTLREAINNANLSDETTAGDCVTGSAGTDIIKFIGLSEQTILLKAPLTVSSYIRFDATAVHGLRLSGAHKHRIFEIAPEIVVEMEGLMFIQGMATEGGAILNQGNLTLIDSVFSNNVADNGGGISNYGELTIMRTYFARNLSQHFGGSLWNPRGQMIVLNSNFFNNSASSGGGISNRGEHSDLIVANTLFANNRAQSQGGGIHNLAGELTVINNTFVANQSAQGGHSIWNQGFFHLKNTLMADTSQQGLQCINEGTIATNIQNLIEDGSCHASYSGNPYLKQLATEPPIYVLLTSSPAIDNGDQYTCSHFPVNNFDQQGQLRMTQAHLNCDIGALEWRE